MDQDVTKRKGASASIARRIVRAAVWLWNHLPSNEQARKPRTRFNKGYAFVNMTTAPAARRLHAFLHGHSWAAVGSGKVCEVVHAKIQVPTRAAPRIGTLTPCLKSCANECWYLLGFAGCGRVRGALLRLHVPLRR
jgi:hypothetical protein